VQAILAKELQKFAAGQKVIVRAIAQAVLPCFR
jgi:hypothetical protein